MYTAQAESKGWNGRGSGTFEYGEKGQSVGEDVGV